MNQGQDQQLPQQNVSVSSPAPLLPQESYPTTNQFPQNMNNYPYPSSSHPKSGPNFFTIFLILLVCLLSVGAVVGGILLFNHLNSQNNNNASGNVEKVEEQKEAKKETSSSAEEDESNPTPTNNNARNNSTNGDTISNNDTQNGSMRADLPKDFSVPSNVADLEVTGEDGYYLISFSLKDTSKNLEKFFMTEMQKNGWQINDEMSNNTSDNFFADMGLITLEFKKDNKTINLMITESDGVSSVFATYETQN